MEKKIIYHKPQTYTFDKEIYKLYDEIINIKEPINPTNLSHNLKYYQKDQDIIIEPTSGKYEYVIILLHGMGVSPITLSRQFFKGVYFPKISETKFIFPKGGENIFMKNDNSIFLLMEKIFQSTIIIYYLLKQIIGT